MGFDPALIARVFLAIPLIGVWIVGAFISATQWSSHPRVSALTLAGIGIAFLVWLIGTATTLVFPMMIRQGNATAESFAMYAAAASGASALLSAAAWGLILAAVFAGRQTESGAND